MSTNVSLVAKGLQTPPDSHIAVVCNLSLCDIVLVVRIDPLLNFNGSGAIVNLVCHVRSLLRDVSHLADKGTLVDLRVVYFEVRLPDRFGFVELLDRNGPQCAILVALGYPLASRICTRPEQTVLC